MEYVDTYIIDGVKIKLSVLYSDDNDTEDNNGEDLYYLTVNKADGSEVCLNEDTPYYGAPSEREIKEFVEDYQLEGA